MTKQFTFFIPSLKNHCSQNVILIGASFRFCEFFEKENVCGILFVEIISIIKNIWKRWTERCKINHKKISHSHNIRSNRNLSISSNHNLSISSNHNLSISSNHNLSISSNRNRNLSIRNQGNRSFIRKACLRRPPGDPE